MKLITAVIQPFTMTAIREELAQLGVHGMTVTDVQGFGQQRGHSEVYRGAEYSTDFVPKVKVEVVTLDERAEAVCEAIVRAAHTGTIGDGKLWVTDVTRVIRVRTGENDDAAL